MTSRLRDHELRRAPEQPVVIAAARGPDFGRSCRGEPAGAQAAEQLEDSMTARSRSALLAATLLALAPAARARPKDEPPPSSYSPVVDKETFAEVLARMKKA